MQFQHVEHILGLRGARINGRVDLHRAEKKGITKRALLNLAKSLSLSLKDIAPLLQVSERTLQRYETKQVLSAAIAGRVMQLAEVAAMGIEVFGEAARFQAWLKSPSVALGGVEPFSLLDSTTGTQMVYDELGRIAHGVYS